MSVKTSKSTSTLAAKKAAPKKPAAQKSAKSARKGAARTDPGPPQLVVAESAPIKLGFVINAMADEEANYTTIRLARVAAKRGHKVSLIGLDGFIYDASGTIFANAHVPRKTRYASDQALLDDLQAADAQLTRICVDELDVLMLRSDPANEVVDRPWAPNSALLFAQLAVLKNVIVLNDPAHLTDASNKTYFQHFPEEVRPATCITMDADEIRSFIKARKGYGVIKPLQGSGGQGVFVVTPESRGNLNQMIEAVTRDGYAIVQEYLPKAAKGDLRLLTLNGRALRVDGTYACIRRYNDSGDARSNISAGGKYEMAVPDADALRLAEIVGPKLILDGMYFVGLDIVGDRMMEINVDTPGGLSMVDDLTGIDFSGCLIDDLERKVRLRDLYKHTLSNTELAMM